MKATVEKTDPLHAVIRVELPWDMVSKELDQAYQELGKNVDIKGFRKGKIPRNVLRQRFGKRIEEDVISRMVAESYEEVLIMHRVRAVARPELERGKFERGQSYQYTAKVEVHPQIELNNIHIPLERVEPEVKPEMIQEALERLREQHAVLTPIEDRNHARASDMAVVDYEVSLDGKPLEGGQVKNNSILLGSGKSVPGFEDQVIGMTTGEKKEFDLTFPKDWSMSRLAGRQVHFAVTLNAIKNRELPELGDEFAKDVGREGCETLEVLKSRLHEELLAKEKEQLRHKSKEKLIDGLIQANPFPIPPSLVDRQQGALVQEFENLLSLRGMAPEEIGLRREQMKKELHERALREVKAALLLEAIAEDQKIEIEPAELEEFMRKMAAGSGKNVEQIKAWYSDSDRKQELYYKLQQEKVLDYLLDLPHIEKEETGDKKKDLSETERKENKQPYTDPGEKS